MRAHQIVAGTPKSDLAYRASTVPLGALVARMMMWASRNNGR